MASLLAVDNLRESGCCYANNWLGVHETSQYKFYIEQEAMESSAFPNKTIKMKLMKLKVDEYHLCLLKLRKNAASCTCETSGKHPFLF